jgi:hypothetical protein
MFPSKLGDIQSIVRKTRSRISVHYLSPEWRSLDRIAKFKKKEAKLTSIIFHAIRTKYYRSMGIILILNNILHQVR